MRRTREQKAVNSSVFTFYNANPKNKYTSDCVVRAIATAAGEKYEDVLNGLVAIALKTGYMVNDKKTYSRYLESKGWKKHPQPKREDGTKYTGYSFCNAIQDMCVPDSGDPNNRVVAHIGGHHLVAIINGRIFDTWNSSYGCIGNFWVKE